MAEKNTLFPAARVAGPELRLLDRRAFVGFPELVLAPGVVITDFALQIPDVTFPLNLSGGPSKYQKKKLDFGLLEVAIDAEVLQREVRTVSAKLPELDEVRLHFRPGHLEIQARLRGPERTPVTFKVAFDGDGERLAVYLYDVRLYSYSTTPAARLGAIVSDAVRELGILPEVERRGANGFTTRILPGLVEQAAVGRGYKMPALDQARLADATVSSKGLRLRFSSGGLPPPGIPDEELLLALEGARAFGDAEELVAQNKLAEAREAYLRLGDATEAHPFAVERLLTLLVADFQAHELVLDIAASLQRRRDKSATALWAEAVVRERRGEFARASERFLALCTLARKNQEEAGAFFAAEAAARSSREHAPHMAVKALHELLGIKPDHLPSLMALARASDQAKDRAGAIRAYRRMAALARDPQDAAEAHVQLARLCAQTEDDVAGARLHCEAALRLSPDHPDALFQLGELCFRSGEWLRAIKALDRVREVAMGRHEVDRVGRANLLAGQVWETGLKQPENALLRYREAVALLPGEAEPHFRAARVSESLGKLQEAVAGYQQAVELAGPAPRTDEIRAAAHASHHALARLLKTKLGEPARAREHLEAALALNPQDTAALDELLPYFRAAGKVAELADACEKAAALLGEPQRRAALWAEAGELYRGRLNQPDKAERLLFLALEAAPKNRLALEGLLALAESKRDGGQLCHCLKTLAELVVEPQEKVRHYRRLIVAARDLAFDLDLAVFAARQVLKEEPEDLPVLGELTALERRRSDMGGLAWALEHRARVAENTGDKRLAAAALRELSTLLDTRLGRAGEALVALEKATRLSPDVNGLLDLATLASRLERPQQARRALEDVLSLLPRHAPPEKLAEVRTRLARTCEDLGDKEAARAQYALAFPLRRLDDELAARLDALYAETQSTRERIELWATRAQALHQAGRGPEGAQLLVQAAALLLDLGDAPQAILRLQAALEMAPTGVQAGSALELLGRLELERGAVAEAARLYARRAQLESDSAPAARWYFKASSLVVDTPREQEWLALALERDSSLLPARLRRAHLNESQRPHEALADFEAVLQACIEAEAVPNEALAALKLDVPSVARRAAVAAQKCGQPAAALRWWAVYAAQHPEDVDAQLELANLYRHEGATEALMAVLGQLWPRLTGVGRQSARREFIEGALSLGRVAEATHALRAQLAEQPADAWAAARLLPLLPLDESTRDERLSLLSRLIDEASGAARAELLAQRAEILRAAGDFERVRQDLLEASRVSPHPLALLRALVDLSAQRDDDATELEAWERILALNGHDAGWVQDSVLRLPFIAQRRTAAQELPLARRAFALLSTLPLPPELAQQVHLGLARIAVVQGEVQSAEQAFKSAATVGPVPQRVAVWLERAAFARSQSLSDLAIESYEGALALSPRHPGATQGLIEALREASDWEGLAEVLASEAAHLPGPQALPLFRELVSLHLDKLSLPGPAEVALRRVAALDPRDAGARLQLAELLVARAQPEEAIQSMEQAAELLPPQQAAAVLRQAAAWAERFDDGSLALRLMRRAQALVPASGVDLERLAEALYLHGAVREALPLQQAWAWSLSFHDTPDVAERAWLRLADLGEQLGDRQLAESSLRRVVSERPLNGQAVERLAQVLEGQAGFELRANWAKTLSPSTRTQELLLSLAREAVRQYRDVEGALRLYAKATSMAQSPLPIRLEVASVLRDAGRTAELMTELAEIAQLQLTGGQVDGALAAWGEESRLAEGSGRIDDALRTLSAMSELCAEEGRATEATGILLRRAELLASAKLDLVGAIEALERAWELAPSQEIARQGLALASRRSDRDGEIDWHERLLSQLNGETQAHGFVQLARLHLGLAREVGGEMATASLVAVDQAEAALHRALTLAPGLTEAEQLLMALYERQDRPGDMAAYYEAQAHKEHDVSRRSSLLLRAAQLYKERAARPHDAAAALLAARSANPDDDTLTARVADLLIELGHRQDAADFDALVLEKNPLHSAFERHAHYLTQSGDHLALAGLLSMRAEASTGADAAQLWLQAADAFHRGEAHERAHVCEGQALEAQPDNQVAFERLFQHATGEPRRQADLLAQRARVLPSEALNLWRQRAELLTAAGDALWAASAWDDVLAVSPNDVAALEARGTLAAAAVGARAAQPFDRRLVQVAGESLPAATLAVVWSRLGHAALESQAWHDAVDAFETVLRQSPTEERAKEALSLLNEAYAHLGDRAGQYRACVRLAQSTQGEESEALYRRALALQDDPAAGTEALEWLVGRHPGEVELYEKAQQAFRALWRWRDLVTLAERYAAAVGGPAAAKALLMAAFVCETELHEGQRAFELRDAAHEANPNDVEAAEALLNEMRRRGDDERLELMLVRLSATTTDEQLAVELKLELANLRIAHGQFEAAREPLETIYRRGPSGPGYAQALTALERVATELHDAATLAQVQVASAELLGPSQRAARLLEAARTSVEAGQVEDALQLTKSSLAVRPSPEGYALLVQLTKEAGHPEAWAQALMQLSEQTEGEPRAALWLDAMQAWKAAGQPDAALELLERLRRDFPGHLSESEFGRWFLELGAPARAMAVAFEPALEAGRFDEAVALATRAGDASSAQRALAAQAHLSPTSEAAARYVEVLRSARDVPALFRYAESVAATAPETALALRLELAVDFGQLEQVEALVHSGAAEALAQRALSAKAIEVLVALLPLAEQLSVHTREIVFDAVATLAPNRRAPMLRALATLRRGEGRFAEALENLTELAGLEVLAPARAALHIERGEVLLRQLQEPRLAQVAFERALLEDQSQLAAVRELVELYHGQQPEKFVAMVERLRELAGPEAVARWREPLALAYEAQGRIKDAYALWAQSEETPERLRHRVQLAEQLGLTGEALTLAEKVADSRGEKERILEGYLRTDLVPFAARLGQQLLDEGPLPPALLRLLAERLAPTRQGAALAVKAWPEILVGNPNDADGWTLLAEALRMAERPAAAVLADAFGAALTSSKAPAPVSSLAPLHWEPTSWSIPDNALPVSEATMPRLAAVLTEALEGLGASGTNVLLDVTGGVEAWLAQGHQLVLGAGALTVFRPPELVALVALALALGERGHALTRRGEIPEFFDAVSTAMTACPSALAMLRVVAHLDDSVRGTDPLTVDVGEVLRRSATFQKLARSVLDALGAAPSGVTG